MPRRDRRSIRANDPVGMRNRVLDVAAAAFQEQGFRGTTVGDVLRAAGVSGGALHHHFPTKRDLAIAVLGERVSPEVRSTWIETVEAAPDAASGVLDVFDMVADALDRRGAVSGCPLGNLALELSLADEGLREAIEGEYQTWRSAIADKLRSDGERARFAAGDPDGLASMVVALFTGAMSMAKAEQSSAPLRACAKQLRRMMA